LIIFCIAIRTLFSLTSWTKQSVQRTSWTCGDSRYLDRRLNVLEAFLWYGPNFAPSIAAWYGPASFHDLILGPIFAPATLVREFHTSKNIVVNKISCYPCHKDVAYAPIEYIFYRTLLINTGQYYGLWEIVHRPLCANLNGVIPCRKITSDKSFVSRPQDFQYLTRWKCVLFPPLSKLFLPEFGFCRFLPFLSQVAGQLGRPKKPIKPTSVTNLFYHNSLFWILVVNIVNKQKIKVVTISY